MSWRAEFQDNSDQGNWRSDVFRFATSGEARGYADHQYETFDDEIQNRRIRESADAVNSLWDMDGQTLLSLGGRQ